jgi:hypothetical protein
MSDEPKRRSRTWTAWLIVLPFIAYVASEGPVEDLAVRAYHATGSKRPVRVVTRLYAPLDWVRHLR